MFSVDINDNIYIIRDNFQKWLYHSLLNKLIHNMDKKINSYKGFSLAKDQHVEGKVTINSIHRITIKFFN